MPNSLNLEKERLSDGEKSHNSMSNASELDSDSDVEEGRFRKFILEDPEKNAHLRTQ